MNADIFAEWILRQGHKTYRSPSSYWFDAGPRTYQAFPFHWVISPQPGELEEVLRQCRAIALRCSTPIESAYGYPSYHVVQDDKDYHFHSMNKKTRQNIRNGLRRFQIEEISIREYADSSWRLQMDTVERQKRDEFVSEREWRRRYMAADGLAGFYAWGAVGDGKIVATMFAFVSEKCCQFISTQCDRAYLKSKVNNALSFAATRDAFENKSAESVFYALQSLDAPDSVDEFKLRMGYKIKPVRQRVVIHPRLSLLANTYSYRCINALLKRLPGNQLLSKGEGLLKFYLGGGRR
ncbi:MAG: GNAT family N-acetyltransferase [Desulfobacterales bacterium]|jgi:hypothetical protein|nr:GNAT family N-acetyltransferase [Desulfobacterales bacterium]